MRPDAHKKETLSLSECAHYNPYGRFWQALSDGPLVERAEKESFKMQRWMGGLRRLPNLSLSPSAVFFDASILDEVSSAAWARFIARTAVSCVCSVRCIFRHVHSITECVPRCKNSFEDPNCSVANAHDSVVSMLAKPTVFM